jgi:hypothetical protein
MYGQFAAENEDQGETSHGEKNVRTILYPMLTIGITVSVLSAAYAATNSNIDPDAKWAWSTNAGWIHFNSSGPVLYKVSMLIYRLFLPLVRKSYASSDLRAASNSSTFSRRDEYPISPMRQARPL